MTQAYRNVLADPNLVLTIQTDSGAKKISAGSLAARARITRVSVSSCPDPYGEGAAARSTAQTNTIDMYSGTFKGPNGKTVSDWGQNELYLHEILHQMPQIGAGGANHSTNFQNGLAPIVGPGTFYKR